MFNNDSPVINYWKLYAVVLAALLTAELISGIVGNAIITHQIKTATAEIEKTTRYFNQAFPTMTPVTKPGMSLRERTERKKQLIEEECRYWIDLYNSEPTKENAVNRSKACKPVGIY